MKIDCAYDELIELHKLIPNPKNNNRHSLEQIERLAKIIDYQGQRSPVIVSKRSGYITKGHARVEALKRLKWAKAAVNWQDYDSEAQEYADMTADNEIARWAELDLHAVHLDIEEIEIEDIDLLGIENFKMDNPDNNTPSKSLFDRFGVPPFSVLDARQGYWTDKKQAWREAIGDNGESRQNTLADKDTLMAEINDGVSILDPVLAEIITRWFSNEGYTILDCFAGDTVFGFVSATLNRNFLGIELRQEQADLNNSRTNELSARYVCDDGRNLDRYVEPNSIDLVFSCPPYFDLEVYSDDQNDASNQGSYDEFLDILRTAFTKAVNCLKPNRFAAIVVGDVRCKKTGKYWNFPADIKNIFIDNGMVLYNDLVLVEPVGTARLRAARLFNASRKMVKTHQNVLIFYKGDTKNIKANFPEVVSEEDTHNSED